MSRMVSGLYIVGRTIVKFDPGNMDDGRGGIAHDPRIYLDDGSILRFVTEELECGSAYGTCIVRNKAPRRKSR